MGETPNVRAASPRGSIMLDSMSNLLKYIPSSDIPPTYTIVVRGEEFKLSKSQIEFDSPNYFTSALLGDFREAATRTVLLPDRNPQLFRIIIEYLSGYSILPLAPAALPPTMSMIAAMKNLVADASFYGLSRLHDMLTLPQALDVDVEGMGFSGTRIVRLEEVIGENLPEGIEYIEGGLFGDSAGMHQPALVYARDLPFRIIGNAEVDRATRIKNESLQFCLDYTPASDHVISEGVKNPPTIIADAHPDCMLHINNHLSSNPSAAGASYSGLLLSAARAFWRRGVEPLSQSSPYAAAIEVLSTAYPHKLQGAPAADVRHEEVSLWADEVLFTVVRRGNDVGGDGPVLHVRLFSVKARTRAAILDGMSPLASAWGLSGTR